MAEAKKTADTAPKMVTIKLPRDPDPRHPQQEFYSINFKNYIIKRGEYVEVPEELAKMIEEQDEALEYANKYSDSVKNKEPKGM